jgi:hypothetical protein
MSKTALTGLAIGQEGGYADYGLIQTDNDLWRYEKNEL